MAFLSILSETSRAVKNGVDMDLIALYGIHDAVVALDHFAESPGANFGDNATGLGKLCQPVCRANYALYKDGCVILGVLSDERGDVIQVLRCLGRPDYLSHFSSLFLASACGTPCLGLLIARLVPTYPARTEPQ